MARKTLVIRPKDSYKECRVTFENTRNGAIYSVCLNESYKKASEKDMIIYFNSFKKVYKRVILWLDSNFDISSELVVIFYNDNLASLPLYISSSNRTDALSRLIIDLKNPHEKQCSII